MGNFHCDQCSKTFENKIKYQKHLNHVHQEEDDENKCETCDTTIKNKFQIKSVKLD